MANTHFPTTELTWVRITPTYWSICAWKQKESQIVNIGQHFLNQAGLEISWCSDSYLMFLIDHRHGEHGDHGCRGMEKIMTHVKVFWPAAGICSNRNTHVCALQGSQHLSNVHWKSKQILLTFNWNKHLLINVVQLCSSNPLKMIELLMHKSIRCRSASESTAVFGSLLELKWSWARNGMTSPRMSSVRPLKRAPT